MGTPPPSTDTYTDQVRLMSNGSGQQELCYATEIVCLPGQRAERICSSEELTIVMPTATGQSMAGTGMLPSWKGNAVKALLKAFEERPCLWNNKADVFLNKELKNAALREVDAIMGRFGISRASYKKKFAILRSQYFRELSRERKSLSGYISQWKWYHTMSYLGAVSESEADLWPHVTPIVQDHRTLTALSHVITPTQVRTMDHTGGTIPASRSTAMATGSPVLLNHGGHEQFTRLQDVKPTSLVGSSSSSSGTSKEPHSSRCKATLEEQSEEAIFGLMITKTLQRLTPLQRALAKKRISDVLYDSEIAALNDGT